MSANILAPEATFAATAYADCVRLPLVLAVGTFALVLLVVAAVLVLLVVGGVIASGRVARRREADLRAAIERADRELAAARAGDHGWDGEQMEAAVRGAWETDQRGRGPIARLHLVRVVDRPGTAADEAIYRVVEAGGREHELVLKRAGGGWTT